ncbi:MAG: DUF4363 family protein [Oscillospiraceae bacterium]
MNRVITACCLIAVIIIYSASAALVIRSENAELTEIIGQISEYNEKGDSEKASAAARRLNDEWHSFEKKMSVFVRDDKLNSISTSVARISPYIDEANDELDAELQNIRRQLDLIYRGELPVWYNIL